MGKICCGLAHLWPGLGGKTIKASLCLGMDRAPQFWKTLLSRQACSVQLLTAVIREPGECVSSPWAHRKATFHSLLRGYTGSRDQVLAHGTEPTSRASRNPPAQFLFPSSQWSYMMGKAQIRTRRKALRERCPAILDSVMFVTAVCANDTSTTLIWAGQQL